MRLLFIAPTSSLAHGAELSRIGSGMTLEIIDGLLDRAGLERALHDADADIVHFCGHGGMSVLELGDGALDAGDLVSMLGNLRKVKFFVINACDSLSVGIAIHNTLHVPVIAMDAEIEDRAAVRLPSHSTGPIARPGMSAGHLTRLRRRYCASILIRL